MHTLFVSKPGANALKMSMIPDNMLAKGMKSGQGQELTVGVVNCPNC